MSSQVDVRDAEVVEAAPAHRVLGTIVSDDQSPSFGSLNFRRNPGAAVTPGDMVAATVRGRPTEDGALVICRVLDVHETNPHEDAVGATVRDVLEFESHYAAEGESTVIYRIARTEPVEEVGMVGRDPGEPREMTSLPLAGAAVVQAPAGMVTKALGLLPEPDAGLHVGDLHGTSTPAVLTAEALQRHLLIVGGTGSGKSHTRGVLAEEMHRFGVCQVNLDVNREMVEATDELGGHNLRPGRGGLTLALSSLTREDVLEMVRANGVRSDTNIEKLIGAAVDELHGQVLTGARATFDVDDLAATIEEIAPRMDMAAKGTLYPAMKRAQALESKDYIGPSPDWVALLQPGAIVNIDCWALSLSDLRIIAAAVARELQRLARAGRIPFTALSIDEFHLVCPNDDRLVSTQVIREIARIGRHFGLGLVLTTQSPSDVDRSILKRTLTRFIHTIEPDQLDSLRGVFADAPKEMTSRLPKLPRGTCLLSGVTETVRHATLVDVRARETTHGGHTPDMLAKVRAAGWHGKRELQRRDEGAQ